MTTLDLAYDQIPASYDRALQRLNSVESRVQALMAFSASFLLTGPALVALTMANIDFTSWWLAAAVCLALLNLVVGAVVRTWGEFRLPEPHGVDTIWLQLQTQEFKEESLMWANIHFEYNRRLVNRKGRWAVTMTYLFLVEIFALTIWGLDQLGN